jgi:hypothetical protein
VGAGIGEKESKVEDALPRAGVAGGLEVNAEAEVADVDAEPDASPVRKGIMAVKRIVAGSTTGTGVDAL